MASLTTQAHRNRNAPMTFENLKGLRAEAYVRDSTLDQRDGFGPDLQRRNIHRFADSYELALGDRWYTEFVSGRQVKSRHEFQEFIEDARVDSYDVLLVDHTSRFGRNQEECIRFKGELQRLGKVVVFVSQGIISGSDRDFLSERINETLDEQYSRNLSRYVSSAMAEKAIHGYANGVAPLGYRSDKLASGKRERKLPDPETMPILTALLQDYATGQFSFRDVADRMNAQEFRTRNSKPFTGASVRDVLDNRFYEEKVVYHRGQADEEVRDGIHEVPPEVKKLWLRCQEIKHGRRITSVGHPRGPARHFPFSRILSCDQCGSPYYGEAAKKHGSVDLRLSHERRGPGRHCNVRPRSRSVESLSEQFAVRVLPSLSLDPGWKAQIIEALREEPKVPGNEQVMQRLQSALKNLRKQHIWGDLSDEAYQQERITLERQLKLVTPSHRPSKLPNLGRAAGLLNDLSTLWSHPGVTHEQRETLVREVFTRVTIDGKILKAIEPKPAYAPLFASIVTREGSGYHALEPPPSPPQHVFEREPPLCDSRGLP